MKAIFEKITIDDFTSIRVYDYENSHFDAPWHFHPEFELTLILKSKGKRYVGSSIDNFEPGDLVLLGPNLPHIWKSGHTNFKNKKKSRAIVIHFTEEFTKSNFFEYREMKQIKVLLDKSRFGVAFTEDSLKSIKPLVKNLVHLEGFVKLHSFLQILHKLSISNGIKKLNGDNFLPNLDINSSKRINTVCKYIYTNFSEKITLKKLADLAGMSENAFSRYFKERVYISVSKFIIQVRLNQASFLLIETDLTVSEICYECGFSSISNFNKQFKKVIGITPVLFRSNHNQKV